MESLQAMINRLRSRLGSQLFALAAWVSPDKKK